ncbi:hypothetical protein, partial [Ruegeria sp. HKCCA6837]|uniref:hypothetical protein n=1 Tax=Ruegeria sp. HKCCA6837 TaxID=2682989 RepID=UPI001C2B7A1E
TECWDAMSQVWAMLLLGTDAVARRVQMIAKTTELNTRIFDNLKVIVHVEAQCYYVVRMCEPDAIRIY